MISSSAIFQGKKAMFSACLTPHELEADTPGTPDCSAHS
jgi:hypothetical protein